MRKTVNVGMATVLVLIWQQLVLSVVLNLGSKEEDVGSHSLIFNFVVGVLLL